MQTSASDIHAQGSVFHPNGFTATAGPFALLVQEPELEPVRALLIFRWEGDAFSPVVLGVQVFPFYDTWFIAGKGTGGSSDGGESGGFIFGGT